MVPPDLFCRLWNTAVLVAAANYLLLPENIRGAPLLILLAAAFLLLNLFPSPRAHRAPTARLRVCGGGGELLILFLCSAFDGANDGLVAETSFPWGEKYTFLTVKGRRGISHGDVIDMNRENIPGFDVREFFVELVSGLRERGF